MATGWKRIVELGLVGLSLDRVARRRIDPSGVILAWHNVVPRGERAAGDLSLHTDQARFAEQLDVLGETHEVISLERALAATTAPRTRPWAVITFDDAYRGALTAGLDELARRRMPGTVMVAPGILDRPTWWDLLAPRDGGAVPDRIREHALVHLGGRTDPVMAWARREGLDPVDPPAHAIPASQAEVEAAGRRDGIHLAAHSWSHANLATLDAAGCAEEYERSRTWVRDRAARFADWLAYPYGLYGEPAVSEARTAFQGALRVDGGAWVRRGVPTAHAGLVPRVNVPRGLTLEGFRLRLAGLLG